MLPTRLAEFQTDLAGRLVLADQPGLEVRNLRDRYGFKQEWLAERLGLRRESLSRIESGHVAPSVGFIQRFTRVMTLARGVREHLASLEMRNAPRAAPGAAEAEMDALGLALRLDPETAGEIIARATESYEEKRKAAVESLRAPAGARKER
ncbi:MAG TPA: helix-turn-helix transcriptional regulator [Candidatus Thermoplasmatota archaeon]|nr:helix-turn-helix transcriptional regulator [Candidatus Thermoplasmatota archaeon]